MNVEENKAIAKTKQWLEQIIIGLNFCPFAKKEFVNNTIEYHVCLEKKAKNAVKEIIKRCDYLHQHAEIETSLVIFPESFQTFERYLDLVTLAEDALYDAGYEGVFQLASMHPDYCFAGESYDDASNFTNRSPLPMVHIIREESLERVLNVYKNPEQIPENNVELSRAKGSNFFEEVLNSIHQQNN